VQFGVLLYELYLWQFFETFEERAPAK